MATTQLLTRDEIERDIRIVERYQAKDTLAALALRYDLDPKTVKLVLARAGVRLRSSAEVRALVAKGKRPERACRRCEVLLSQAPAGADGLCGWCVEELTAEKGVHDG